MPTYDMGKKDLRILSDLQMTCAEFSWRETMSFKRITTSASPIVEKTSLSQPLSKIHRGNRYYKVTYRIYSNKRPISN